MTAPAGRENAPGPATGPPAVPGLLARAVPSFPSALAALAASLAGLALACPPGAHPLAAALFHLAAFASLAVLARTFPVPGDPPPGQAPLHPGPGRAASPEKTATLSVQSRLPFWPSLAARPGSLTPHQVTALVLGLGLAARLAFLQLCPPGSDLFRYIWEGYIQTLGFNPYALAPADPTLAPLAHGPLAGIWAGINHKDLAAIYPPLAQLAFRLTAWVSPTVPAFKTLVLACDLGTVLALACLIRDRGLAPTRLALYLLNPLVLLFVAGEGHMDALMALPLVLALVFHGRGKDRSALFCLGCAAMCKYPALAALPFLLTRRSVRHLAWAALPLAAFLPFLEAGSGLFRSLSLYGLAMWYNDSLMVLARLAFGPAAPAAALAALALFLAAAWLLARDTAHGTWLALGAAALLSPSLHPWHLVPLAALLPLFPSRAWLWLMAAQAVAFVPMAREMATGLFHEEAWLRLPEYLPFLALLAWEALAGTRLVPDAAFAPVRTLSVVIPARNEEAALADCLASVQAAGPVLDLVVADGGSTDATRERAEALGARAVLARPGRGVQIAAGLAQARGDAVLVLHADCRLDPGVPERILAALNQRPDAPGGAVGMRFADRTPGTGLIQALNALRAGWLHIPFGDQGQFFRTSALPRVGGFPDLTLMEDVELALRLKTVGPPLFLGGGVLASDRRWRGGGFAGKTARVLALFARYLAERRLLLADRTGMRYYRKYYGCTPGERDRPGG